MSQLLLTKFSFIQLLWW